MKVQTSVLVDDKLKSELKEIKQKEGLTIPYFIKLGVRVHTGEFMSDKIIKITQKLSEYTRENEKLKDKIRILERRK